MIAAYLFSSGNESTLTISRQNGANMDARVAQDTSTLVVAGFAKAKGITPQTTTRGFFAFAAEENTKPGEASQGEERKIKDMTKKHKTRD